GVQIDKLAASLRARWLQRRGEEAAVPEGGYLGAYVTDLAAEVEDALDPPALDRLRSGERDTQLQVLRDWAVDRLRQEQDRDLRAFGVTFDAYYTESRLYAEGHVQETLDELRERGLVYEAEGAIWLRTSEYGDDKDRVLLKSDGTYTYFLPDLAYHREKARRGFEHVIDVWGADHHGYVPRMKAALEALGLQDFLDVEIVQMVRILRGG
ncbi:MAG: arginine--tRNA ligase, partial [Gemmatimonadetes bacterium]|nr:arginine--tRNA ligase [Gemmatimonadota bacterium]NIQ57870.1 arginine--tRNA ligase [Gemmatimonadota bacterium]NIU78026.1 arginine--tRNA ligase [Gammaproteobacteria bacterium]NIX47083.1 arginine--tRNA ligase [Gemmatimonadota bacterium]NIY11465.1 arginine--tRNA ligase [Gemmatimonadota bacterium]